jgi:hypothetical protein
MQQNINQTVDQTCDVQSTNDINNIQIFAANSDIQGNVAIGQSGNTVGNCAMNNVMNATEYATGFADNCAASGKKSKKSCAGKFSGTPYILIGVGIVIAIIIAILLYHHFTKGAAPTPSTSTGISSSIYRGPPSVDVGYGSGE